MAVASLGPQSRMLQVDKRPIIEAALTTMPRALIGIIGQYVNEILGGLYGPEAWKVWKDVEILDEVPGAPNMNLEGRILIYRPLKIRFRGQEKVLTGKVLKAICGSGAFALFRPEVEGQCGDNAASGWFSMEMTVIPESRGKDYVTQKRMVEDRVIEGRNCSLLHWEEAVLGNVMHFEFTGVQLYGENPLTSVYGENPLVITYTRCADLINGQYPVVVGNFGSKGLEVFFNCFDVWSGVAYALRS